jgi:tryptophanyl-tRNA synthetase
VFKIGKTVRIDPWGSAEIKDYKHVFKKFGLKEFPNKYKLKHRFFERGIMIAHRDFDKIFSRIKNKKPFINMTGIATSGKLHLGHKVDIDLFKFFKSAGGRNYFGICDIDGYVSRPDKTVSSLKKAKENAVNNLAHVLALGLSKKDVYIQSKKNQRYYEFTFELSKKITENMFRAVYGHLDLGKVSANLLQYADILHGQLEEYEGKMPSITGIGIEQDPHAKLCRDLVRKLQYNLELPSFIYFTHQSGLQKGKKMSSSEPDTAIFLDDSSEEVKRKINKAYSGGRDSVEEHRRLGGIPEKDKAFEILLYHHPNSDFVQNIYNEYKSGELLSGELKMICKDFLIKFLKKHQSKMKRKIKVAEKMMYDK